MNVTGECTVSGSREALFDKLADPFFFASCFDGVSGLTETGPGRYDAAFETTVAYMKFRFKMQVEIVRLARACRPYDRLEEFPAVAEASRELQERVKAKWPDLLT